MATEISLDEAFGPTAARKPLLVPASRTSIQPEEDDEDFSTPITTDKRGSLPKDTTILNSIKTAAQEFGVPLEYGLALAEQESGYNPTASNAEFGAAGLYQFIPSTAQAHGIDPRDPAASARAAMKDFSEQMKEGGTAWAIKHHFAGPDKRGHGPKTRQYLADVEQRASDIRAQLSGSDAGEVGGSSDVKPTYKEIPLDQAFSVGVSGTPTPTENPQESRGILEASADYAGKAVGRGYNYVKNRFLTDLGQIPVDSPDYTPRKGIADPFAEVRDTRSRIERRQAGENLPPAKAGFWANIENPVKLVTEDSLPANLIETIVNAPEAERARLMGARQVMQQEKIAANPSKFPAVAVEAAKRAIAQREAKQEPGIREMWGQLKKAAKDDPGRFAAQFANALMADPEMILAPEGIGLKLLAGTRKVATGVETASKIAKVADKVIDAGTTGAALNLGIEASAAASEGRSLTPGEAGFAAATGGGASALFAGIFSRGKKALADLSEGNVNADSLDGIMRDVAADELAVEQVIERPESVPTATRDQIERSLGIQNMSQAERKKWHAVRQKELKRTFEEQSLDADYYKFKAEERISRTQTLAEEAQAREAATAAETAKQLEVDAAHREQAAQRSARLAEEYDNALAQREASKQGQVEDLHTRDQELKSATEKLDEQEILDSAFDDVPAVRNAMLNAAARDSKLAQPKWQRGDVDPRLLATLGVGGLFAGTAFAVAPPEQKMKAAFAGGLAGLLLPKGGRVLDRMRQSGAVTLEGDIVSLLAKEGKLKLGKSAEQVKARDLELVNQASRGDQRAYKELYEEYFPQIKRYVKSFVRDAGPRMGVDAEDVAQEAFVKAFQNLDKFQGNSQFSTWLHSIARNEGLQAIRDAQTAKGGGQYEMIPAERPDMRTAHGESYSQDVFDEGAGSNFSDTPENQVVRQESEQQLIGAIQKLPEAQREAFVKSRIEQMTAQEIADASGENLSTILMRIKTADEKVTDSLSKSYGAKKSIPIEEVPKRGRGRPRKQTGEVDPRLLQIGGVAALGATAGAYLNEENPALGATIGALAGGLAFAKGRKGVPVIKQIVEGADYALGATSTRIMNKSKPLWRRAIEHERVVLRDTHKHMKNVDPFLVRMQKLPKQTRDVLSRAILTGKPEVTRRLLEAIGDKDLIDGWKNVKSSLDSLGDQLVALKRFKSKELDYFPRIVKDVDGLIKALGRERGSFLEEALKSAEDKAIKARGTGLTELERSLVINKVLASEKYNSQQPGFAKQRGIEEITPELQPFYATPAESLHTYIRSAVEDIERAKFFGKDLQVVTKGDKEFTNVDTSIGNLVQRLINEDKLAPKDAEEVGSMLKSRFQKGEKAPHELIQASKNLSYAGLLGSPFSAASQLGDVIIQAYTQDIRSTLGAVLRQVTGKKIVDMKDFGLSDHLAEEFVSTSKSAKALNKIFKVSLFKGVDEFGKNTALNASILRNARLARTEGGIKQLASKYAEALAPDEFNQLVKDLQKGEASDLVKSIAFAELSRTQPITRLELPQAYLDHPNGRLLYQFKTFMLKQIDVARRDGYNEIKKGNRVKGLRQLAELGLALGVAGTTTSKIKDFMLGKDINLEASDIPMNMLKTFGLSEYIIDHAVGVSKEEAEARRDAGETTARATSASPIQTAVGIATPAVFQQMDEIITGDPKAVRYIPLIGPLIYQQQKEERANER